MQRPELAQAREPWIVAVAGPSGAGKTHFVQGLVARLPFDTVGILQVDDYYRDLSHLPMAERARANFDHPDAVEYPLLAEHLRLLRDGRCVEGPVYDFGAHVRGAHTRRLDPAPLVVVEGIFALYWPEVRDLAGLRVYVDAPDPQCLSRRIRRDYRERQRTREDVLRQYEETVRPMCDRYVRPTAAYADLLVQGDEDAAPAVDRVIALLPPHLQPLAR